jgi:hypothetical protein
MITSITATITALQSAFEDEDRFGEAKDALDDLNRALHLCTDPELAALATATLELGYSLLD